MLKSMHAENYDVKMADSANLDNENLLQAGIARANCIFMKLVFFLNKMLLNLHKRNCNQLHIVCSI